MPTSQGCYLTGLPMSQGCLRQGTAHPGLLPLLNLLCLLQASF